MKMEGEDSFSLSGFYQAKENKLACFNGDFFAFFFLSMPNVSVIFFSAVTRWLFTVFSEMLIMSAISLVVFPYSSVLLGARRRSL